MPRRCLRPGYGGFRACGGSVNFGHYRKKHRTREIFWKSPEARLFLGKSQRAGPFMGRRRLLGLKKWFPGHSGTLRAGAPWPPKSRAGAYGQHFLRAIRFKAPVAMLAAPRRSRTPQGAAAAGPGNRGPCGTRRFRVRCAHAAATQISMGKRDARAKCRGNRYFRRETAGVAAKLSVCGISRRL